MAHIKVTLVVACALVDADKRVLIAQRPEGRTLAGMWEFPGGKVGPGGRQGGPRRAAGADADPRAARGNRHHRERSLPRAAHLRQPRLRGFPSVDAALHLPALGRRGDRARGAKARLGPRQQAARLPDAAGRHSADPAADRFVDVREVISRCRPCESRDPYAAASRFGTVANGFGYNSRRWLWMPAFAGTTHHITRSRATHPRFSPFKKRCSPTRLRDLARGFSREFWLKHPAF